MTPSAPKRRPLTLAAAAALALSLCGCISLFPSSKPAQLYRFGVTPAAAGPARPSTVGVFRAMGQFQREAAGDQILTLTGERAAYVAGARWVAPAEVLFDEAVSDAFAGPGRVRLISRGEQAHADYALRLEVRNFETDYAEGGPPTVLIRVRAVLTNQSRATVAEQVFEARTPAAENRVSAIVAAYDQALSKVLGDIVAWTNGSVAA
jgi:cholesterol transport system auxiliary component